MVQPPKVVMTIVIAKTKNSIYNKSNKMKKFWKILGGIFDWILIIFFAVILFGGGAWVIKNLFF